MVVLVLAGIVLILLLVAGMDENTLDNSLMFQLLRSRAYTKSRTFQLLTQSEEAGRHRMLGWDTAGTADPACPKRYSRPYGVMLSI